MQLCALGIARFSGKTIKKLRIGKLLQDMKKCDPKGRDCIEKNSAETFNCSMTCKGMYADINWKVRHMKNEMDKEKYTILSSEYENFKKENVKHFEFSSALSRNNYGKQILQ